MTPVLLPSAAPAAPVRPPLIPISHLLRLLILTLPLLLVPTTAAADPAADFAAANRLYEQGRYPEAAAAYQTLLATGRADAPLLFNLGNALFKAGRVGEAILHFRRASLLAPRDPDIRANLQFARNSINAGTPAPSDRWQQTLGRLTLNEWTVLAATGLWSWLLLLALPQWRPTLQPKLRVYTLATGLATFLLATATLLALQHHLPGRWAILTVPEAIVRYGPVPESPTLFAVRDGAELRISDRQDLWLQVTDDQGRRGWIESRHVALFP